MPVPQLIIFDCDGVLVDSESLSSRVIAEEVNKLGAPMLAEEAQRLFSGGSLADVRRYIEESLGITIDYDLEAVYRKRSFELFEAELEAVTGVEEALKTIHLQKCVASNGPLNKIIFNLKLTNLLHHFNDHLFSAYEVKRWKPDPFLFLHAAAKMGIKPADCLVVEDSVHGVQAAVAAGIPVLGYSPHHDGKDLVRAGATAFSAMHELPELIHSF